MVPVSLVGFATVTGVSGFVAPTLATPQPQQVSVQPQPIKVYFPKNPLRQPTLGYVEPVLRYPQTSSVARFAIAQVIAGPTRQERQQGFFAPINLRGASNCGSDFRFSIVSNTARLQFCRPIVSGGVGDDARMLSSLNATLKQFPTVRSVVILDSRGNCLGDMSGENRCLRR